MPSGNRYELQLGQYNFVEDELLIKALGPGERWITVHPNGKDAKGQPVLVREESDGSLRVIGGAGGKLNYLRLRGVKSESDYRKEAAERRQAKSEQRREQHKRDKELGLSESKVKAREAILAQRRAAETDYIQTVAQLMGWNQSALEFPESEYSHLSATAVNKLRNKHHRNLLDRAKQAVDLQRQKLLSDEESRLAAGIGEIPFKSQDDEILSVDDLDPIPSQTSGLGYSTDYKGRAKQAGLTEDELSRESGEIRSAKLAQMTDAQRQAAIRRGETSRLLKQELENIREPVVEGSVSVLDDSKMAIALLKAEKKLKTINQQAKMKMAEVDAANTKVEPKAFILEYSAEPDIEKQIAEDIENDLRTAQTRAFLSEFKRLAGDRPEETVGKYMGVGAYNSINSLALAVGGDALIDRSVVDVLGIAGAAQVLARRIHTDLKEDAERVTEGMQDFHLHHYMETSEHALNKARELMDVAREIGIGEGATGGDLKSAQELNAKRRAAVTDAQKIVGQALGEMEANAALVVALKQGTKDALEVSLGDISIEQAITRVRATGLQRGDYQINSSAGQTFLSINSDGMDRLAKPINREDIEQIKRNLSIIRGDYDEEDWLPLGVANRPDLAMNIKPGMAPRLAEPFQPGEDLEQSLRDYIGGRTADGDTPADILADIQSLDFFKKAGDVEAYRVALDAVAPLKDESGKSQRIESLSDRFEEYADQFVHSRFGETRLPVNRQKFEINQNAVDALHRALSEIPEGVAAYKQIGELTSPDQRALREYFYRHVAKETPEANMLRHDLERLTGSEPKKEFIDIFGDTAFNPEWTLWNNKRNELSKKVRAASLTWDKYIGVMRGHEKAYESIQDLIRSRVSKKFIDEHNKLNRDEPLKLGRSIIRNNLHHLDATDQDAREARLAEQRSMIDHLRERSHGKYASGSVIEKLQEARERKEAFEQSQMALFSTDEMPAVPDGVASDRQDEQKIKSDERYTLGHEAERQLAGMMGIVGKNFRPGQPVKLWNPTMSGSKNAARQRLVKLVDANRRVMAAFGTGCVHGDTVLNDAEGRNLTFFEWWRSGERPVVLGMAEDQTIRQVEASPVFVKGVARMVKVVLASGQFVVVTGDHKVFSEGMGWVKVKDLNLGDRIACSSSFVQSFSGEPRPSDRESSVRRIFRLLRASGQVALAASAYVLASTYSYAASLLLRAMPGFRMRSSLECCRSAHHEGDLRCCHTGVGFQCGCHPSCRSYDEPHRYEAAAFQGIPTSLCGAQARIQSRAHSGALGQKQECNRSYQRSCLHAMTDSFPWGMSKPRASLCQDDSSNLELFVGQRRTSSQAAKMSSSDRGIGDGEFQREEVAFSEVVCVEPYGIRIVFDISVPNCNSYLANGIVHHNSGKSLLQLASFTHLHEQGKAKRGLFLVPSIVQGQFSGEALRYLEPNKFNWHIEPGASRDERIAAYKNPDHHFAVMTHSAFRDDMIHLGAKHAGVTESEMAGKLNAMTQPERKEWMRSVMDKEGINFDYLTVDESQYTLNRQGKENSILANVVDAMSANTPYYLAASGDPVKNDASEIYDLLRKMDPDRYNDRGAFLRRYGVDTLASKDALRREMARYVYPSKIDPDVSADRKESKVELSDGQKKMLNELDSHFARARMARMEGKVDTDAVKAISPQSFEGVPHEKHEEIARKLQQSLGIMKSSAIQRVINTHPDNPLIEDVVKHAAERKGKPGVVFAHNLESVKMIAERLQKEGHNVVTITGSDSAQDKDKKRLMFHPESGEPGADILVASDAGATGMNIQRGQWMYQFDVPQTAMVHAQRNGRIFRVGQKNDVELIDGLADHPEIHRARERLKKKYGLRDLMTSSLEGLDDTGVAAFLNRRNQSHELHL
ncbi:MAG TPA: helicase-related protein [Nitrosomonas halophila]|nr:helicase-related protein [Nitrosomonas halophila]